MRGWLMRWFPLATRGGRSLGERFTPLGKWLLSTCGIAGIFSADPTRTHAFLLFTTTLALLVVSFTASVLWRPRVRVARELPLHASVGVTSEYSMTLHNVGRRDIAVRVADRLRLRYPTREEFAAEVADAPDDNWFDRRVGFLRWQRLRQRLQGATLAVIAAPSLRPGESAKVRMSITPLRRGWLQFDAVRLLQPDPLGLCYAVLTVPLPGQLLSRPQVWPMPAFELPRPGVRPHVRSASRRRGEGLEFFALRDYRPGDPPKFIDWRASARRGTPIVRQFALDSRQLPRLLVDTSSPGHSAADFEASLCIAASVLFAAAARGHAMSLQLLTHDDAAPLASMADALDALALLSPGPVDTCSTWAATLAAASDEPRVIVTSRWDAPREALLAALATDHACLVLCTDPAAADAAQVLYVADPASELPALTWPAAGRRLAS